MGYVRLAIALIRLLILLFTRRWGLIVVGCACMIAGLIMGLLSHEVTYQRSGSAHIAHYLTADGDKMAYMQLDNGPTLFTVEQDNFTPAIGGGQTFQDGDSVSVVYRTDTTTSIDETSTIGTHLSGDAYPVIEIHDFDTNTEYTTDQYNQNPVNYYQNNWIVGSALLGLGALMAGFAIFLPLLLATYGKKFDINIDAGAFMARPGYRKRRVSATPVASTTPGVPATPLTPGMASNPAVSPYTPYTGPQYTQPVQPSYDNPYANPYTGPTQYQGYQEYQPYQPYQAPQSPQSYPPYQPQE